MDTKKITYMAVALMWLTTTESQAASFKYCCNIAFSGNKVSLTDVANKIEATDTSRVYNLDEVVIVSQPKEALLLRQQPLSSSMFTGNDINSLGITDLSMLASYVPSFAMPAYGSRLTSSMYIRGIGSRVNNPAIGIYVDGIPMVNKSAFNIHTYQIDRTDILRGPQGTLYGMNTEGGLLRLYTKNPMKYQGTDIHLGLGTHFQRDFEAAHYGKLGDNAAFSIAGFYSGSNGFFKNQTTGNRADNYNEAGGKARFVSRLTDKFTIDFTADYQYVNQNAFPYGLLDITTNNVESPSANRQNSYKRNMLNTGLNLKYATDKFTLTSTTSYQFMDDCMMMDQDYLASDFMHLEQRQLTNAITQELTIRNNTEGKWKRATGLYGSYQWLRTDAPVFFDEDFTGRISGGIQSAMYNSILKAMIDKMVAAGMPQAAAEKAAAAAIEKAGGINVSADMKVPATFNTPQLNIGVFHESNISLTDRLTATLGLRYDYNRVKVHYDTYAAMAITANVMGQSMTNTLTSMLNNMSHDNYSQLLPKVGLSYTIDSDGSNVYATVCKGYRAGGYNIQMFSDILQHELNENSNKAMTGSYDIPHTQADYDEINNTISYKPEESWNYEIGAHLNLFDNKIHADLAVYYMQIRNQQLSVMAGEYGFGRMMVNAGKSISWGLEAALRGSAFDNSLTWSAGYGLTRATFKEYNETSNDTEISYNGKRVPFIPMHTLNARADYRIRLNGSDVQSIVIGADVTAQGRIYWNEANTYSQPFYALLGAHADINFTGVSLKLWCRNITDTHYNTFAFDSSASGQTIYLAQRGTPIQAGFDINLHF